jgi:hypothetical protein
VNIGNLDILLNNPYVIVGDRDGAVSDDTEVGNGMRPVTGLMISARAQVRPVRVRLWLDAGPAVGPCVFDGTMIFPDGYVCLSDPQGIVLFLKGTGRIRADGHRVCIYADDDKTASRIDILIDADGPLSNLTAVPGYELAPVRVGAQGLNPANELALILDGCDSPFARLAAALKLALEIRLPNPAVSVRMSRAELIAEWMRGLGAEISTSEVQTLTSLIDDQLTHLPTDDLDQAALDLATKIVRAAGLQAHVHNPGPTSGLDGN